MADRLTTLQSHLARLLRTRDALVIAIEHLATEIAETMQEIEAEQEKQAAKSLGPDWDQTLPSGLSAVHRKTDAERNVV